MDNLNFDKYKKIVKEIYFDVTEPGGSKGFRYYHSIRVFQYCKKILELDEINKSKMDRNALLLSALFHDIGGVENINDDGIIRGDKSQVRDYEKHHEDKSVNFVNENLADIPNNLRERVESIIGEHHSKNPNNPETLILQDADNLDELGYMTIFRIFTYTGFKEQSFDEMIKYYKKAERNNKLEEVLNRFNFKSTKKIGEKRVEKAKKFMEELIKEHNGDDIL